MTVPTAIEMRMRAQMEHSQVVKPRRLQ